MKKTDFSGSNGGTGRERLLHVKELTVEFSRGVFHRRTVRAVDGVSFDISHGETLGLVGESGCGKSTLARAVVRLIEPTGGKVRYKGTDLSLYGGNLKRLRKKIQIIFQDADGALNPRMKVADLILEPLRIHGLQVGRGRKQAMELLNMVNLPLDVAGRRPQEISGGQRQRVVIARAVSLSPDLIIADEAAASLDMLVQAQIMRLLKRLQSEKGMSYLYISHDLRLMKRIADRLAVMFLGKFVEAGEARKIFERPFHPYTKALLGSAVPGRRSAGLNMGFDCNPPDDTGSSSGCVFAGRCPQAHEKCLEFEPSLSSAEPGHQVACHLFF